MNELKRLKELSTDLIELLNKLEFVLKEVVDVCSKNQANHR